MTRRSYSGAAEGTTLSGAASSGALTLSCTALVGWPDGSGGPFTITVDQDEATEEVILCDSITGSTITVLQRGYAGTTASAHSVGATVRHTACAVDFDEANEHANATSAHGISGGDGSIVGTLKTQTLENKTITSADNDLTIDMADITGLAAAFQGAMPVGVVTPYAGSAAPTGWLLCDGTAVSRTTYASLFTALGTTYGSGDGSTTFNLPNLKGRVPVGRDAALSEFDALGETGGSATHLLTESELPSHNHTQNAHTHTQDAHTHTQNAHTHTQNAHLHSVNPPSTTTPSGGTHNHVLEFTGAGSSNQNVATGVAGSPTGTNGGPVTGTNSEHTHTVDIPAFNSADATATNQNATATNQNATATNQNATATNNPTGGGGAHNNLQPYLVLNYIIRALPAG